MLPSGVKHGYPLVIWHIYWTWLVTNDSWFAYQRLSFSIVMLVYQRVAGKSPMKSHEKWWFNDIQWVFHGNFPTWMEVYSWENHLYQCCTFQHAMFDSQRVYQLISPLDELEILEMIFRDCMILVIIAAFKWISLVDHGFLAILMRIAKIIINYPLVI